MSSQMSVTAKAIEDMFNRINDSARFEKQFGPGNAGGQPDKSFMDHLGESLQQVNQSQNVADKQAVDVASGKQTDLHEAMIAASKAELSFNLMVQVRNKALEAYMEIMRMPV